MKGNTTFFRHPVTNKVYSVEVIPLEEIDNDLDNGQYDEITALRNEVSRLKKELDDIRWKEKVRRRCECLY